MHKHSKKNSIATIAVTFIVSFVVAFTFFYTRPSGPQRLMGLGIDVSDFAGSGLIGSEDLEALAWSLSEEKFIVDDSAYGHIECAGDVSLRALYDEALQGISELPFDNPTAYADAVIHDFIAAAYAYSICDIKTVSKENFSVSSDNYAGIYRYYRAHGYNIASINRIFLYDFADNAAFFANGDAVLAYGIFMRPQTELYVRFFETSRYLVETHHRMIAADFWQAFDGFDFRDFNAVLASLLTRHMGVENIIMVDSYRVESAHSPALLTQLIIVHELRHLIDWVWHSELFVYQPPLYQQVLASLRTLIGKEADSDDMSLSAEFIRSVDLSVFHILKGNEHSIRDKAPPGHILPGFSRYRTIVINNFREFARGGYGEGKLAIEPRAYDEEIRYMLSLAMTCNDVMKFFSEEMVGTVERTANREYLLLPTLYNPHSQSYQQCSRVQKQLTQCP